MKTSNDYQGIIFDLGGVILNLDFSRTIQEFKTLSPGLSGENFLGRVNQASFFSDYEIGKITSDELVEKFNQFYESNLSTSDFTRCWNAMILDFPMERIHLIEKLRRDGRKLYLLSNINELHELAVEESFRRLNLNFSFFDLFDKVYYSHRVGLRKPDLRIFKTVLENNLLTASKTLFIDDSLQHVVAARELGIEAIHLEKPLNLEGHPIFTASNP
jgi:glucose-1-phosphatase